MKKLNAREKNLTSVAIDLFLKGTPEWRIAYYAQGQGFTAKQLSDYLDKVEGISEDTKLVIYNHFRDIERQFCYDKAKKNGADLKRFSDKHNETFRKA